MRHTILVIVNFIIGIAFLSTNAQTSIKSSSKYKSGKDDIRLLEIGDQCPDFVFEHVIRSDRKEIKISDFKGKLLIIDFWSIGCGPCYAAMPKNDSLQKKFGNLISILPVNIVKEINEETKNDIDHFWRTSKWTKNVTLPTVIDTFSWKQFGVYGVPFEVWINGEGQIIGLTKNLEYLNSKEIELVLSGKKNRLPNMRWIEFDYSQPLINSVSTEDIIGKTKFSILTKNLPLVRPKLRLSSKSDSIKIKAINLSILDIFTSILNNPEWKKSFPASVDFIVDDSTILQYDGNGYKNDWNEKNTYCFESTVSINNRTLGEGLMLIINDLTSTFGFNITRTLRPIIVFDIIDGKKIANRHIGESKLIKSFIQDKTIEFESIESLIDYINATDNRQLSLRNVQATNQKSGLRLPISALKNEDQLRDALNSYGLSLKMVGSKILYSYIVNTKRR